MNRVSNVMWGLVLIILGVTFGLNATGITDINIFFKGWWTLFLIVPGFIGLFKNNDRTGNIILIIVGVILLLCTRDILDFDIIWKLIFPVILVIIGISIIFKDLFSTKINKEINKLNEKIKKDSDYCSTFGSQNIKYDDEEFKGATLNSVFGGIKLDLRDSIIKGDVVINSTCVFGGITILVPKDIKIKIKSTPIFGGVEDKTKQKVNEKSKTIYSNSTTIFGGVEIK